MEWERAPRETLKHRLQTAWGYNDADNVVVRFDIQRTEELIHGFDDPVYGLHEGLENLVGGRAVDVIIGGLHAKHILWPDVYATNMVCAMITEIICLNAMSK